MPLSFFRIPPHHLIHYHSLQLIGLVLIYRTGYILRMKQPSPFIVLVATVTASISSSVCAFTTSNTQKHQRRGDRYTLFAEEEGGGETSKQSSPLLATKNLEEGSHDELMYALGVNLARQLGDVRPLVENSEELTQLAR